MKNNQIVALFTFMGLIMLAGCTEQGTLNEELKDDILNANTAIETYTGSMSMHMDMVTETADESVDATSSLEATIQFDRPNKKAAIQGVMSMLVNGNPFDTEVNTYLMGTTAYTESMGRWTKIEIGESAWEQQDQINQMTSLMESGTIRQLPDQTMNGKTYYVIEIMPDIRKLAEIVFEQQNIEYEMDQLDFGDLIQEYSATIWVNKNTKLIEKTDIAIEMVLSKETFKETTAVEEGTRIVINSQTQVVLDEINGPVSITLPEEAQTA